NHAGFELSRSAWRSLRSWLEARQPAGLDSFRRGLESTAQGDTAGWSVRLRSLEAKEIHAALAARNLGRRSAAARSRAAGAALCRVDTAHRFAGEFRRPHCLSRSDDDALRIDARL